MEINLKDYKDSEIYRGDVDISMFEILKTYKVIDGDVYLDYSNLESFKDFKVEIVTGCFDCSNCDNLKSLKSSLKIVYGDFWCSYCKNLENLEGLPIIKDKLFCWYLLGVNLQKSIASILNSGIQVENIYCDPELKVKLQFANNPNDFVKLRGFKFKIREKN